jgi:pyruvate kinase
LRDCLLGPADVAALLQAGLASVMKESSGVQLNQRVVLVDLPTLSTDKDISDIQEWGIPNTIDFIAASFVRKTSDVHKI